MKTSNGLKVLSLEIVNHKCVKAIFQELFGEHMHVAGVTGQGKTTAISALWDVAKTCGDPIRHGEKKGAITITLGDGERSFIVQRKFTRKSSPLTITGLDGEKIGARDFQDWFCNLGINPHQIMDMKPAQQLDTLLGAVKFPEGVDLFELDAQRDLAAEDRLEAKRDFDRLRGSVGAEPEKIEAVNVVDLHSQSVNLLDQLDEIKDAKRDVKEYSNLIAIAKGDIVALELQIQERCNAVDGLREKINTKAFCKDAKLEDDLLLQSEKITTAIQQAEATNEKANAYTTWFNLNAALEATRQIHESTQERVKELDAEKKEALEAAVWPLPGLSIDDGEVLYNDVPLSQHGKSVTMLVCGALAAHAVKQKPIRVVRMDGIESMSAEDFNTLVAIFEEHDIQVFSSRVARGDVEAGELEIVDGEVVS